MAAKTFKITINDWEQHNGGKKKNHRYFMLENRFFEDAKVSQLKQIEVLIFLKCLSIAGDLTTNSFEIHAGLMPKRWRVDVKLLSNSLKTLQQFQLLTVENIESFIHQNNTKEDKTIQNKSPAPKKVTPESKELNRKIWDCYRDSYHARYKVYPIQNRTVNSQISQIGKRLGEEAVLVVKFFLTHNDQFYLKGLHAIGLCLTHAEALRTQMLRGRAVTSVEVRQFEKSMETQNIIRDIQENGI